MKGFDSWNKKKIALDSSRCFSHPKEGEIWWCSIGMNVGTEVFGKGQDYTRPVLIVNARIGEGVIAIPLTSRIKNGTYSCVIRMIGGPLCTALVSQVRNLDKRRLAKKMGCLERQDYNKVIQCLFRLYKIL